MHMSLSERWELVMDREAWRAAIPGSPRVGHDWATALDWTGMQAHFSVLSLHSVLPFAEMVTKPPGLSSLWVFTSSL